MWKRYPPGGWVGRRAGVSGQGQVKSRGKKAREERGGRRRGLREEGRRTNHRPNHKPKPADSFSEPNHDRQALGIEESRDGC